MWLLLKSISEEFIYTNIVTKAFNGYYNLLSLVCDILNGIILLKSIQKNPSQKGVI